MEKYKIIKYYYNEGSKDPVGVYLQLNDEDLVNKINESLSFEFFKVGETSMIGIKTFNKFKQKYLKD